MVRKIFNINQNESNLKMYLEDLIAAYSDMFFCCVKYNPLFNVFRHHHRQREWRESFKSYFILNVVEEKEIENEDELSAAKSLSLSEV